MNLITTRQLDTELDSYLHSVGEVFRAYRQQDSGCISYGVQVGRTRYFVKHSSEARGIASLRRAAHLYQTVAHPALPGLLNQIKTPGNGLALVLEWLPGEILYDYVLFKGEAGRNDPGSAHARFRRLPVPQILAAIEVIFQAHLDILAAGFIAVDFYDGCILYDFDQHQTHLVDLDEYNSGAFTNQAGRLPGSARFMAPEEFQTGARIDEITNIYTLGRTALILLGDGSGSPNTWRGSPNSLKVANKASSARRENRFQKLQDFVLAWKAAC